MRIGLAAYRFINNDLAFNKSQIETAMQAARGKADLLCFGETFLQGFDSLNWDYEHDWDVAICQDSDAIRELCALTRRYGVDLLLGYVEREQDRLYSSCILLAGGEILHNYRRISRGWKEYDRTDSHYCEGTESRDFLYRGNPFRIALCGDLWEYPERFQTDGVLLWPVYVNFNLEEWRTSELEYAQQAALAAAKTLLVNSITDDPESIGGAFVFENGRIAARIPYQTEDILYTEIENESKGA